MPVCLDQAALARRTRLFASLLVVIAAVADAYSAPASAAPADAPRPSSTSAESTAVDRSAVAPRPAHVRSGAHAPRTHRLHGHDPHATRVIEFPGLGEITVYAPSGNARGLALFASGDGGWALGMWDMAQAARDLGYWVAGFSTPALLKMLEHDDAACSDAAGLLERIGAHVSEQFRLPAAWHPYLIGYSSGATVVYAALAQAGDTRFAGAMTLGFCPDLLVHKPFCRGAGLTAQKQAHPPYGVVFDRVPAVAAPWIVLQGEIDQVCKPWATAAFVRDVAGARLVMLPKVGHGYGVPRNWMPQYRAGLEDLLATGHAPR